MRKLTTMCCLAAVFGTSFMGCQKNESDLLSLPLTPPSSNAVLRPLSNRVFELTNQSHDYQHFTIHLNPSDTAQPIVTLNNNARFALTYFHLFEGEKEKIYTLATFQSTLIEAGLSESEAKQRTYRIFNTSDCSPTYLTETAQLLSPTLPAHTEGAFICELYKPYQASQTETISRRTLPNDVPKILYKKTSATENIKDVHKLVGVSGSIMAYGNSRVELFYNLKEAHSPISLRLDPQEVRLILQATRGYTEGEAIYLRLILGGLTEQEVWQLFEIDIFPELQKTNKINPEKREAVVLTRLVFRYNYVEIMGSTGRLGYTVYDLEGFTNERTVN